jgi:hypothetical protein
MVQRPKGQPRVRIRSVKPEFFKHEELFEVEREAKLPLRLAFAGLWCAADREGRFKWRPRQLGTDILPYDNVDFSRVLDALTTRGFVVRYRVGDEWYGWIPKFTAHQVINTRERASVLPDLSQAEEVVDACPTRAPRVTETHVPAQGEGKGKERNKEQGTTRDAVVLPETLDVPEFRQCWSNFQEHRRKLRKPMTPQAERLILADCEGWGVAQAVDYLNNAIKRGWQSPFVTHQNNGNHRTNPQPTLPGMAGHIRDAGIGPVPAFDYAAKATRDREAAQKRVSAQSASDGGNPSGTGHS